MSVSELLLHARDMCSNISLALSDESYCSGWIYPVSLTILFQKILVLLASSADSDWWGCSIDSTSKSRCEVTCRILTTFYMVMSSSHQRRTDSGFTKHMGY